MTSTIVFSLGIHRPMSFEEQKQVVGDERRRRIHWRIMMPKITIS